METNKLKKERIILDTTTVNCLEPILAQVKSKFGDQINVNQKLVANFILQHRCHLLTDSELEIINHENQDIVRVLSRALQAAKKAKQNGNDLQLNEVLNILQTPSVGGDPSSQKPLKRKKKKSSSSDLADEKTNHGDLTATTKEVNPGSSEKQNFDSKNEKNALSSNPDSP